MTPWISTEHQLDEPAMPQFDPDETLDTKRSVVTVLFQLPNGSTKDGDKRQTWGSNTWVFAMGWCFVFGGVEKKVEIFSGHNQKKEQVVLWNMF